jgi:GT2 family glycosyltransferase
MKKVSIVIVNYNGERYISNCLEAVFAQDYENTEVLVLDNHSSDRSVEIIRQYPKAKLILNPTNVGFGVGNNLAVKIATGDYIALLNPDTIVDKKWLSELVNALETGDDIGATGSKIFFRDTPYLDSAGSIYNQILVAWSRGVLEKEEGHYDQVEEVPMVTACSMLFRSEILKKTHLFDPDFFMYMEEVDFCMRIRNLGYRIVYTPKSILRHFVSQSVVQVRANSTVFIQYHVSINRAKIIGLYLTAKDILKNLHIIAPSFLYWNYYFIRCGEWRLSFKMAYLDFVYFFRGIRERTRLNRSRTWLAWARPMSFADMVRLRKDLLAKKAFMKNYLLAESNNPIR